MTATPFAPTVAIIDLSALARNLTAVRRHLSPACHILAVVKADAYGHGAVPVTRALAALGVERFGVASLQEGQELRRAGITEEILILGGLFPEQIPDAIGAGLTPVLHRAEMAAALAAAVPPDRRPFPIHLKIDTGMTRLGLDPDQVLPTLSAIARAGALRVDGLMTHLSDADDDDPGYTNRQVAVFQSVAQAAQAAGFVLPFRHAANTAGILCHPDSHLTMVRPGLMLYGYALAPMSATVPDLEPLLTLHTRVLQVRRVAVGQPVSYNRDFVTRRPSRLAVLSIGYADGYPRLLSNRGAVLIRGRRASIVGRVCMDMTIVDVTDIPDARDGDDAILIGAQGGQRLSAVEVAGWADTIPYEILSTIGPRVPRVYRSAAPSPPAS